MFEKIGSRAEQYVEPVTSSQVLSLYSSMQEILEDADRSRFNEGNFFPEDVVQHDSFNDAVYALKDGKGQNVAEIGISAYEPESDGLVGAIWIVKQLKLSGIEITKSLNTLYRISQAGYRFAIDKTIFLANGVDEQHGIFMDLAYSRESDHEFHINKVSAEEAELLQDTIVEKISPAHVKYLATMGVKYEFSEVKEPKLSPWKAFLASLALRSNQQS